VSVLLRFLIGGLIYMGIEVSLDNTSHRSMGIVGGLLFVICGSFDEWLNIPFALNCFVIAMVITIVEYFVGKIVNKNYTICDYRKLKFNIGGQVCLTFYLIWMIVIAPIIILFDNFLR